MVNDEQDVDGSEQDCPDTEEVAGPDLTGVRAEKIAPARRLRSAMDASHLGGAADLIFGPRRRESNFCALRVLVVE